MTKNKIIQTILRVIFFMITVIFFSYINKNYGEKALIFTGLYSIYVVFHCFYLFCSEKRKEDGKRRIDNEMHK